MSIEGQAALELESALHGIETDEHYRVGIVGNAIDWEPMIQQILYDAGHKTGIGEIAAKVHNTLVESIVIVAQRAGEKRVVLSGGCFQNKYLTERTVRRTNFEEERTRNASQRLSRGLQRVRGR